MSPSRCIAGYPAFIHFVYLLWIQKLAGIGQVNFFAYENIEQIKDGFDKLAISLGQMPFDLLDAGRKATRGLATDFDIMSAANKAMLFGLKMTPEQFAAAIKKGYEVYGKAARAAGIKPE